jgi:PAS domain S-box-containing protein
VWPAVAGVLEDCPLAVIVLGPADADFAVVWANRAFGQLTGYHAGEVTGSGLDSLVGGSDPAGAGRLREGVLAARPDEIRATVRRRDGRLLPCSIALRPLRAGDGALTGFAVWLTARAGGQEQRALLAQAEAASADAKDAKAAEARAILLAEATSDLAISLDVAGSLRRLARLAVPILADWVVIDLADENCRPVQVAMLHRDGLEEVLGRFAALQPDALTAEAPIMRILAGEPPMLHAQAATRTAGSYVRDRELLALCDALGICSAMYVPLTARGRVLGCITLVSGPSGRIYTAEDLRFAVDLGRRAALVVDNTGLYEREHRVARVLQESLLPKLPEIAGLELAGSYLPSERGAEVGGDFYDALVLPDGSAGLAVGDVVGHDITAAAAMGQLRGLLQACSWELDADGGDDPGRVLDRLDRLVQAFEVTGLATVFYARAQRQRGPAGHWAMSYAAAGHPPPMVRLPDGRLLDLDRAQGAALGLRSHALRPTGTVELPPGSLLVAFTDGLVERRGEDWDTSVGRIRQALADAPANINAAALAKRLAATADRERRDDIAILVARFRLPRKDPSQLRGRGLFVSRCAAGGLAGVSAGDAASVLAGRRVAEPAAASRVIVNHTLVAASADGLVPQASERRSTRNRPRPRRLAGSGSGRAAGVPPPESVTSTRSEPPVISTVTWKRVRACWTAFIASSETITDTASRCSAGTEPIAARTNRRAAGMEAASGANVRAVFTG